MRNYNKLISLLMLFYLCRSLHAQPLLLKEIPSNSKNFISANGRLYFTSGDSLFRSDGTTAGTVFVAETGEPFKQLYNLTVGSFFYFTTTQPDGKTALWKSNGYANNTFKIKSASIIKPLLTYNVSLYFGMDDGISGYELHRVTSANVFTLVADINPGSGNALGNEIITYNGFLYFNAYDPVNGENIWKSNGTSVTHLAVDLPSGYFFSNLTFANSSMYYLLSSQSGNIITSAIWKTNGTTMGSSLVKEFSSEDGDICVLYNKNLINYNNTLYFDYVDGCGIEVDNLYKSDGTDAGTVFIKTLNLDGYTTNFFIVNNKLVYYHSSQGFPGKLSSSDGTAAGTQNIHQFAVEPPRKFAVVGNLLFFIDHTEQNFGAPPSDINKYLQLYQSDLSTTTTLKNLFSVSYAGSNNLTEANGKLFFTTYNDHSSVLPANRVMKLYYYAPATPLKQAASIHNNEYEFEVYPNPSQENFYFSIKSHSNSTATADIYRIDGTLIKRVFDNKTQEGNTVEFSWNAAGLTGGVYFCKFTCGEETVIKRIVLNK